MFRQIIRSTLAAVALVSSLSCTKRTFLFQPNSVVKGQDYDLTVDRPSEADVLFVIDSSGSMKPHQDNLIRNAEAFIRELATSPNKFQIGITTTDLNDCTDVPPAGNPWDGKCGRLLSPDGTDPIMRRVDYEGNDAGLIARFQATIGVVGTTGSGYEQGLKAAALANDPSLVQAGRPNAGFLRPDALLGIVIVSDETDCSYSFDQQTGYSQFIPVNLAPGQSCYEYKDKLEPTVNWAQRLASASIKGRPSLVAVGTITAGTIDANNVFQPGQCLIGGDGQPTAECSCFNAQPLAFCGYTANMTPATGQIGMCGAEQGGNQTYCCEGASCCIGLGNDRYQTFADYFRLRYKDSICRNAYGDTLRQIANILKRDCFELEEGPANDNPDYVLVKRRAVGETAYVDVPRTDGIDGEGWFYFTESISGSGEKIAEICLAGSYKRVIGDSYKITLVSEVTGTQSNVPAKTGGQ